MKKIIIGILLFFNLGISISNQQVTINAGVSVCAQYQCPPDPGGNGTNPGWWGVFTGWITGIINDAISFLGELFSGGNSGYTTYTPSPGSLFYQWGSSDPISYVDVYYEGDNNYACFYTPSIFGGPYRGGHMWNCNGETPRYVDCAYQEHNSTPSGGISGRSNEIAYLDECNECVGGSTGLPPCSSPLYYLKLQNADTKYYDGDTITIEPSGNIWSSITLHNEHGVPPPSVSWTSTSNTFWYWPWDIGNTFDLVTNSTGDYTITVYDGGMIGYSTISTNHLRIVRTDTVKPTPQPCDSLAVDRGNVATSFLNQIATSPELKQMRDSAKGNHEVAFSTYDSAGSPRVHAASFVIGDSLSVPIYPRDTIIGANHRNINSLWHLHQQGADPFPDPADLFNLLLTRALRYVPSVYNSHLNHSFIVCGDTLVDLAVVVYDTLLALQYVSINPRDSVIKVDSLGPNYSPTYKGLPTINVPRFNMSMGKDFDDAYQALLRMNYPDALAKTYAGAYMMQRYNMGIKTLMNVNGVFKELSVEYEHRSNGRLRRIKIKICN